MSTALAFLAVFVPVTYAIGTLTGRAMVADLADADESASSDASR